MVTFTRHHRGEVASEPRPADKKKKTLNKAETKAKVLRNNKGNPTRAIKGDGATPELDLNK